MTEESVDDKNNLVFSLLSRESAVNILTVDEILQVHREMIEQNGGIHGLRDIRLLEFAAAKPLQYLAYTESPGEQIIKGAGVSLFYGIIKNHAFIDGNKRTALACAMRFFAINNARIDLDPTAIYKSVVKSASGEWDESDLENTWRLVELSAPLQEPQKKRTPRPS